MTALWEEHVLQLPEPSNLTAAKAQNMLFPATQGCIGLLDQVLCEAGIRAIQTGKPRVDLDILKQVIAEGKDWDWNTVTTIGMCCLTFITHEKSENRSDRWADRYLAI